YIILKNILFLFLNFYTARDEITNAIKYMIKGVKNALEDMIDESLFAHCLYTYKSPNSDLVIRTSRETRLSDLISNSCIYFTEALWPEFSIWTFLKAIFYCQRCYPYLQKNWKPIMHNTRVFKFVKNLHKEREIMIEKPYQLVD
ncbi:DHDDS synthase, partial [Acromyrmex charruanus]